MAEHFTAESLTSKHDLWFLEDLSFDISAEVNDQMFELAQVYNLAPPFAETPAFSHTFFDDPFYVELFRYITNWYDLKDSKAGKQILAPVPNITKTWEYYCIAQITNAFLSDYFIVTNTVYSDEGDLMEYTLSRGSVESLTIYYEPKIYNKTADMPIIMTVPGHKVPDFVLYYQASGTETVGIIDAKFTSSSSIVKWSKEIYEKYGVYFRKNNGQAIDYVISLYPAAKAGGAELRNYREGAYAESVLPFLGIMVLPVADGRIDDFYAALKSVVRR